MIGIVNYQRGNLNNVYRAFTSFGFETEITDSPENLERYNGLVLPGVGAFQDAMETLKKTGFDTAIKNYIQSGRPFMGICLGLQLLFEESLEFGKTKGLGVLKGKVVPFQISLKVPHMGWNQIRFSKPSRFIQSDLNGESFYFVHSYFVVPEEKEIILSTTSYEIDFVSSIEKDNVFACQFHPEKSQKKGLKMIKNFGDACARYTSH
ncbi:MAG TPA: imidazole glycerol phosphate synthase subunit HisH [Spirochaetia bacterium]|nr:MAG: imidazole glycerol phosphate synthase, glutamine amidotransferase subunit [Spirochaetes bacterium GWB1_36_13]HCL57353.1 imidazole glycerol phosphate synthase subunit HisH [Spirochaetia bacterium]